MNQNRVEEITIKLADKIGLINITKERLCFETGIPVGSFNNVMGRSFTSFISYLHAKGICELGKLDDRLRVNPDLMKDFILNCAIELSEKNDYKTLTRAMIADQLAIAPALVSYYFGEMESLKNKIVKTAIERENLTIIAQAVTFKHPAIKNISEKLKTNALKAAING